MSKKLSIGGLVRVKSHTRGGKMVKSYTRGSSSKTTNPTSDENGLINLKRNIRRAGQKGGTMGRVLGRKAKGILRTAQLSHAISNPNKKSLKSIVNKHKEEYKSSAGYMRRGIDRKGYKGGGKLAYLIDSVASKRIKL